MYSCRLPGLFTSMLLRWPLSFCTPTLSCRNIFLHPFTLDYCLHLPHPATSPVSSTSLCKSSHWITHLVLVLPWPLSSLCICECAVSAVLCVHWTIIHILVHILGERGLNTQYFCLLNIVVPYSDWWLSHCVTNFRDCQLKCTANRWRKRQYSDCSALLLRHSNPDQDSAGCGASPG